MKKSTCSYSPVRVDTSRVGAVAHAGGVLLTRTVHATGLTGELSQELAPWRKPLAVHDPAKVLTDLALSLVLGGDALSDAALLRAEPDLYGLVGSEATISRTITTLAKDASKALKAINTARVAARARAWDLAGERSPGQGACASDPIVVDLDATLITAHSEKEQAEPTYKKDFGFHPLCAFVDHGPEGTGEPLAIALRHGKAGFQHFRRSHRRDPGRVQATARDQRCPARQKGVGPHRWGRRHQRLHPVADRPQSAVQRGIHVAVPHP